MRRSCGAEDGQTAAEYVGVIVVLAVVVAAVLAGATGIGQRVATGMRAAVCQIAGGTACDAIDAAHRREERLAALVAAEDQRAAFVAGLGGRIAALDAEARSLRESGDLAGAERLSALLAAYARLAGSGPRAETMHGLLAADASTFDELVGRGTIQLDDGRFNTRYFQSTAVPGEGVVVFDFFIAAEDSGFFLEGDDRGHADPITVPPEGSRMFLLIDRETGRGQIFQTETCTVSAGGRRFCNEPRPIAFSGEGSIVNDPANDITGEGINLDQTNRFDIVADAEGVRLTYDALNSVTPLVVSVDGTVAIVPNGSGSFDIAQDERDTYPSIGIYHYPIQGGVIIVDQQDEESVFCGALPFRPPGC